MSSIKKKEKRVAEYVWEAYLNYNLYEIVEPTWQSDYDVPNMLYSANTTTTRDYVQSIGTYTHML